MKELEMAPAEFFFVMRENGLDYLIERLADSKYYKTEVSKLERLKDKDRVLISLN